MWQHVISFDNRWLSENGMYDPDTYLLDETKIKETEIKRRSRVEISVFVDIEIKSFGKQTDQMQATYSSKLVENLKKLSQKYSFSLFLQLKSMSIDEILRYLDEKSNSICKVAYLYAAIHRLLDANYILERNKKTSRGSSPPTILQNYSKRKALSCRTAHSL